MGIPRIWSLLTMFLPLIATLGFTAGFVPVAMTMNSASNSLNPVVFSTRM